MDGLRLTFLIVASAAAVAVAAPEAAVPGKDALTIEVIGLHAISVNEARELLTPFLSEQGKISFLNSRNVVVVRDRPDVIKAIRDVLAQTDVPRQNIRIAVTFDEASHEGGAVADAGVRGAVVTGGGGTKGRGQVTLGAAAGSREVTQLTTQFVTTADNLPARIWVGQTVAEPAWVFDYGCRHGWWRKETVWKDLGASLWVRPRLVSDSMISVDVYPRLALQGDTAHAVDVKELSTQVMVPVGGSLSLGGLDQERQEFYRRLLGVGKVFDGRRLAISLQADVIFSTGAPPAPGK